MLLAGLYDVVTLEGTQRSQFRRPIRLTIVVGQSEPMWTFTIVTTSANKAFSWLHDRQPVILSSDDALSKWLDTSSQTWNPELAKVLNPYSDTASPLEWYEFVYPTLKSCENEFPS